MLYEIYFIRIITLALLKIFSLISQNRHSPTTDGRPTAQQLRDFQNRLLQQSSCGPSSLSDGAHSVYSKLRSQN